MATTYSELAEKLSKQKGKFEKLTQSTDPAERFTGERMGKSFDNKLEILFDAQESLKAKNGIQPPSFQRGGDPIRGNRAGQNIIHEPTLILPTVLDAWKRSQLNNVPANGTIRGGTVDPQQTMILPKAAKMFNDYTFSQGNQRIRGTYVPPENAFDNFINETISNDSAASEVQDPVAYMRRNPSVNAPSTSKASVSSNVPRGTGTGKGTGVVTPAPLDRSMGPAVTGPKAAKFANTTRGFNTMNSLIPNSEIGEAGRPGMNLKTRGAKPSPVSGKRSAGEIAEGIAPFLDNFANLLNPTPRVPVPNMFRTPQFETKYNIEPQLQEMRRGLRTYGNQVDRSVGQGNVAAAYKAKGLADYFRGAGQAYGQKENTERGLRNANTQAVAQVDQANTEMMNNYQLQNTSRSESERLRRMGMINNLGEDFLTMRNDRLMRELDTDKFAILGNVFKDVIQSNPEMKKLFEDQLSGGIYQKGKKTNKYGGKIKRY